MILIETSTNNPISSNNLLHIIMKIMHLQIENKTYFKIYKMVQ
jgi:hypothetical protein